MSTQPRRPNLSSSQIQIETSKTSQHRRPRVHIEITLPPRQNQWHQGGNRNARPSSADSILAWRRHTSASTRVLSEDASQQIDGYESSVGSEVNSDSGYSTLPPLPTSRSEPRLRNQHTVPTYINLPFHGRSRSPRAPGHYSSSMDSLCSTLNDSLESDDDKASDVVSVDGEGDISSDSSEDDDMKDEGECHIESEDEDGVHSDGASDTAPRPRASYAHSDLMSRSSISLASHGSAMGHESLPSVLTDDGEYGNRGYSSDVGTRPHESKARYEARYDRIEDESVGYGSDIVSTCDWGEETYRFESR